MQNNRWNRKLDWIKSGSTSPFIYYQQNRTEIYNENRFISVGDIYFKLNKYLTGVTFTYIISLVDVYNMNNLLTGDGYSLVNMYNEYDVIDRAMKNIIFVDAAADTNIDTEYQWFEINDAKLKPGHLVLLKNQANQAENDIYYVDEQYFLWNAGYLSTREKSDKFSCSVKLGKNADKQFFLLNNGYDFPIFNEPKNFIEGKSYILKNLIQYNLLNDRTGSTETSKIIFTDYDLARKQISENYERYDEILIDGIPLMSTPSNYATINYHHDSYMIRSGSTTGGTFSGIASEITNIYSGFTSIPMPTGVDFRVGDYIYLNVYSGSTFFSGGTTHLEMWEFIKSIESGLNGTGDTQSYIFLEETIPNYILTDLKNCDYFIENLTVATDWYDAIEKLADYTPYCDFYSLSTFTWNSGGTDFLDIRLSPKESAFNKYFDYDGLVFFVTDSQISGSTQIGDRYSFNTSISYLKYNLYDRLNQINSGFTSGFTFFNEQIISGDTLQSYLYTDNGRIKITTAITGLTDIFKPYTYINIGAVGELTKKTLVYSVTDHEIIIERPVGWTPYPTQVQLPEINFIQNIDGLKNISDILYEVYMNDNYDWYLMKNDNERKYIAKSYADLLTFNSFFRSNVTGILYENDNNEFILKLYDIVTDTNLIQFESIELIYIGADRKSRLPVPLNQYADEIVYLLNFDVLDDGGETNIFCAEIYDAGLNNVLPGINNPPLLYTQVDGGLNSV
jgi:hypothetical protein